MKVFYISLCYTYTQRIECIVHSIKSDNKLSIRMRVGRERCHPTRYGGEFGGGTNPELQQPISRGVVACKCNVMARAARSSSCYGRAIESHRAEPCKKGIENGQVGEGKDRRAHTETEKMAFICTSPPRTTRKEEKVVPRARQDFED